MGGEALGRAHDLAAEAAGLKRVGDEQARHPDDAVGKAGGEGWKGRVVLGAELEGDMADWCEGAMGGLAGGMPVGWGRVVDGNGLLFILFFNIFCYVVSP